MHAQALSYNVCITYVAVTAELFNQTCLLRPRRKGAIEVKIAERGIGLEGVSSLNGPLKPELTD